MGESCVDGLAQALSGAMRDNVKWNIIDILARIKSPRALPILETCAQNPTFESVCREAIAAITGTEPPSSAKEPEPAVSPEPETSPEPDTVPASESPAPLKETEDAPAQQPASETETAETPKAAPEEKVRVVTEVIEKVVEVEKKAPTPAEVKQILEELFSSESFEQVKEVDNGFNITLHTDKSRRRQRVNVFYRSEREDRKPVVTVYSVCCAADPQYYERALIWNRNIADGTICITDIKERKHFVLLQHLPYIEADRETLLNMITTLGNRADTIEKVLTGAQDFQ
jgi:hypothetical protein